MRFFLVVTLLLVFNCKSDTFPKPKAYLSLDYPQPIYKKVSTPLPFTFEKNTFANPIKTLKQIQNTFGLNVYYPKLKGTIYLSYKPIKGNLDSLLRDAQNLTQKHTVKASEITTKTFANKRLNTYGTLFQIGGNAASQAQFYVTDSTQHFLSGSLYFYAKPNYDSIYPASEYIKTDIFRLIESLEWK